MQTEAHPSGNTSTPGYEEVRGGVDAADEITSVILHNGRGMELTVLSLGCTIQSLVLPDRDGLLADVVLGYDTTDEYVANVGYFGAVVGRYANRIAGGQFNIGATRHELEVNDGANHLHGGTEGFHRKQWAMHPFASADHSGVRLSLRSAAEENGYPGNLDVQVVYTLTTSDELHCEYSATTDAPTIVNLSQHSYWNLAGHDIGDALDHELTIAATEFLPVDRKLIPLGELRPVQDSAFDFRTAHTIGERIDDEDAQLRISHGYDHNFVLDRSGKEPGDLALAARLSEPSSGRVLEIHTTEPGLQFYAGGMIPRDLPGKGGVRYRRHSGIALETQHFPDSPNRPEFPSVLLRPGEQYASRTVYRFLVTR